jgi:hypothetical protein
MMVIAGIPMKAPSIPSRTTKQQSRPAWVAIVGTFSVFALFRTLRRGRPPSAKHELRDDSAMLWDAHASMRCGNPARSWRVMSEWLRSRGDRPEDYGWLFARMFNWDGRVISRLTEARITRLLALRRPTEVLEVVAQRLRVDPRFRPSSAADTLSLAQIAARGGAQRISRILLSDFCARFPGDPRVSVSEALKRRLARQTPARIRA